MAGTKKTATKKAAPPWVKDKQAGSTGSNKSSSSSSSNSSGGRGKQSTTTAPSTGTPKDKRLQGRGAKPGPKPGSAAAKKGSAAGGRASRKK